MQAELERYFTVLGYALLAGIGLFLLRVILSLTLRKRLAPGLVPACRTWVRRTAPRVSLR